MKTFRSPWIDSSVLGLIGLGLLLGGCSLFGLSRKTERSSSVVSFLYPDQKEPLPPTAIPVLRLPLRVGIAFVPAENAGNRGYYGQPAISEMQKTVLMQRVAEEFKGREGQQLLVHTFGKLPARRLLLLGLGKEKGLDASLETLRQAGSRAVKASRLPGA